MDEIKKNLNKIKEGALPVLGALTAATSSLKSFATNTISEHANLMSQAAFMKWLEGVTEGAASVYDKALDADYLSTHIGGGNHRLFDGGHDLFGAWKAASTASDNDTFSQEVMGYASSLWKDFTTVKGLPFHTMEKANYDNMVEFLSGLGISKEYFYDLCSFDAGEVFGSTLMFVGVLFHLKNDDKKKLSEMLGAMGIISIISANPIMGVMAIAVTAYSYFVKKNELDKAEIFKGAALAGVSSTIMLMLGLPFLIELVVVIVVSHQLKTRVFENKDIIQMIERNINGIDPKIRAQIQKMVEMIKSTQLFEKKKSSAV